METPDGIKRASHPESLFPGPTPRDEVCRDAVGELSKPRRVERTHLHDAPAAVQESTRIARGRLEDVLDVKAVELDAEFGNGLGLGPLIDADAFGRIA